MSSKEFWLPIAEFPKYSVSNFGRIKNVTTGRILKQNVNSNGYLLVTLYKSGKGYVKAVHRLVGLSFMGKTPKGLEINHIDGIKTNNSLKNFEFLTRSENVKHAFKLGLARRVPSAGSKPKLVRIVETKESFSSVSDLARKINASAKHVSAVLNGRGKTVKGFHLEFVD